MSTDRPTRRSVQVMTHSSDERGEARHEAIQAVVDRVSSYQDGATEHTTAQELREALAATDLDLSDAEVRRLTEAIERDPSSVDVAAVLG